MQDAVTWAAMEEQRMKEKKKKTGRLVVSAHQICVRILCVYRSAMDILDILCKECIETGSGGPRHDDKLINSYSGSATRVTKCRAGMPCPLALLG